MASNKTTTKRLAPLLVANLIPMAGMFFYGWEVLTVFVVYLVETAMVGLFTLARLVTVIYFSKPKVRTDGPIHPKVADKSASQLLRFLSHFYFIFFMQSVVFFTSFGLLMPGLTETSRISTFLLHFFQPEILISLVVLFLGHLFILFSEVFSGSLWTVPISIIAKQPYLRLFVQQFAVILGGFLLIFLARFSSPTAMLIFGIGFVLAKLVFETYYQPLSEKATVSSQFLDNPNKISL